MIYSLSSPKEANIMSMTEAPFYTKYLNLFIERVDVSAVRQCSAKGPSWCNTNSLLFEHGQFYEDKFSELYVVS